MSVLGFWRPRPATLPPLPPQPEAERDWSPGDVAKCVAPAGNWIEYPTNASCPGAMKGQVLRVVHVTAAHGTVWLWFCPFTGYYSAGHFRKLRPCATDFREQIRERAPLPAPVALPELVE